MCMEAPIPLSCPCTVFTLPPDRCIHGGQRFWVVRNTLSGGEKGALFTGGGGVAAVAMWILVHLFGSGLSRCSIFCSQRLLPLVSPAPPSSSLLRPPARLLPSVCSYCGGSPVSLAQITFLCIPVPIYAMYEFH